MQRIVFRADGNKFIGLGHVYRILALIEMLKYEFECVFVINKPDSIITQQITNICKIIKINNNFNYQTPDSILNNESISFDLKNIVRKEDIVVLDGYHFKDEYQKNLNDIGCKQVIIDDFIGTYNHANAIINHAPGITPNDFKNTNLKFALGLNFAIIRNSFFLPFTEQAIENPIAFICIGGSDYFGYTQKICETVISSNQFKKIHVLCTNKFDSKLIDNLKELERSNNLTIHLNLSAQEISNLMDKCTHAFVSASTVLIESYARKLKCYTGYYTKNQYQIYNGFVNNNLAFGLGNLNELNSKNFCELFQSKMNLKLLEQPLNSTNNFINFFKSL